MIGKLGSAEIYAFCEPVDMRKGFEGLAGIVRNDMGLDPLGGALFLLLPAREDELRPPRAGHIP